MITNRTISGNATACSFSLTLSLSTSLVWGSCTYHEEHACRGPGHVSKDGFHDGSDKRPRMRDPYDPQETVETWLPVVIQFLYGFVRRRLQHIIQGYQLHDKIMKKQCSKYLLTSVMKNNYPHSHVTRQSNNINLCFIST